MRQSRGRDSRDYYEDDSKRGFELLRDDILSRAPSRFGVGPQDPRDVVDAPPQPGEPGYKERTMAAPRDAVVERKKTARKGNEALPDYLQPLPEDTPTVTWGNQWKDRKMY